MSRYLTDAELIAAVSTNAPGKWRYEVYVDESKMGGVCVVVNADNAPHARHIAREYAVRIKRLHYKARVAAIIRHTR